MLVPKSLLTPQRTNFLLNPFEAEERLFTLRLFFVFGWLSHALAGAATRLAFGDGFI
jgi:hypothetical protein